MLNDQEIARALARLPAWRREGDTLARTITVPGGMAEAAAFVTRLVAAADRANHHPDITISWNRVSVTWTTHDAGGITALDLELAAATDSLADEG
ncbi:MAG TPA: 4a-hydroxytetrahydrobiopterin dehydratase [Miltoncostaeaceae bacterium]|nr:4a-hydroxytetrahydrobiopterin dehydratase [Miltoncostaeaceae bacterium]